MTLRNNKAQMRLEKAIHYKDFNIKIFLVVNENEEVGYDYKGCVSKGKMLVSDKYEALYSENALNEMINTIKSDIENCKI